MKKEIGMMKARLKRGRRGWRAGNAGTSAKMNDQRQAPALEQMKPGEGGRRVGNAGISTVLRELGQSPTPEMKHSLQSQGACVSVYAPNFGASSAR
jgi:hypothetical protein